MSRNFVEGHDLTSPVRSGSGSSSPVYADDLDLRTVHCLRDVKRIAVSHCNISTRVPDASPMELLGDAFWRECPTARGVERHDPRRAFGPNNRHEYLTCITDGGTN